MSELIEVRLCGSRRDAEEHALVLSAVGIACQLSPGENGISLRVHAADVERAKSQLSLYARENAGRKQPSLLGGLGLHGFDAALLFCALLLFFFVAARRQLFSVDWTTAGAAQAGLILDGAWWRTITALTLHTDLGHLIGNLGFGAVFGVLLARVLGSGLTWLTMLLAGMLGNAINAALQAPEHTAIGASTAVFGAIGLLSGYNQTARSVASSSRFRRWLPLAGGIMLLAFLGVGDERTDIWAHIWGFAIGGVGGLIIGLARLETLMRRRRIQGISGALAAGLFLLAWLLAVYA